MASVFMPEKTDRVFSLLKEAARDRRCITYEELGKKASLAPIGIGKQLEYIRDDVCRKRRLPWLTAIAVRKWIELPADGFAPEQSCISMEPLEDFKVWWKGMVQLVFDADWTEVEL